MPTTPHVEKHFTSSESVRDVVIGMSDGLTVPFALAAGLSGAVTATTIIITAGLAEIAAGSIAMGLGGYLAARTDAEHYVAEKQRERQETLDVPDQEVVEVVDILQDYGLKEDQATTVAQAIATNQERWIDFMMRFELGLEEPDPARALRSALTIAGSYIVGGMIPLSPYILVHQVAVALWVSVGITLAALFIFGFFKGRITGLAPLRSGVQTMLIGGLAASAAFAIARLIG